MMKFPRLLSILALAGFAFGGPAFAQGKPQASQDNPAQLMQSYQQNTRQLQDIQKKTLQNNPKLSAEMDHFQTEMTTAMRTHGYDVVKGSKRVKAMVAKLRSGKKMSDAERTSIIKTYQADHQKMMQARAAVMQDPKIQKDRKALAEDMISAMKKQDSRTTQLLKNEKALRAKIMAAMATRRAAAKNG